MPTSTPDNTPVHIQITVHATPDIAAQIERGDAFYNVELVTKDLPETGVQRDRVPTALDAYASLCAEGPFCNFSAKGTARIGALCADLAALVRAGDATPGMFNLRSWARYTIAVLATENITYTEPTPMPAEIEELAIRAMEEDLAYGVAIFETQRTKLGLATPAKAA